MRAALGLRDGDVLVVVEVEDEVLGLVLLVAVVVVAVEERVLEGGQVARVGAHAELGGVGGGRARVDAHVAVVAVGAEVDVLQVDHFGDARLAWAVGVAVEGRPAWRHGVWLKGLGSVKAPGTAFAFSAGFLSSRLNDLSY